MARIINYVIKEKQLTQKQFLLKASQASTNALLLSNNIRRDTIINIYWLDKEIKLTINGATIRNLRPDQESTIGLIKALLRKKLYKKETPSKPLKQPCINPAKNPFFPINATKLIEEEGFTIIDPLDDVNTQNCTEAVYLPLIKKPVEAIIIANMVMDLCLTHKKE